MKLLSVKRTFSCSNNVVESEFEEVCGFGFGVLGSKDSLTCDPGSVELDAVAESETQYNFSVLPLTVISVLKWAERRKEIRQKKMSSSGPSFADFSAQNQHLARIH